MVVKDTVDENIYNIQCKKTKMNNAILGEGENNSPTKKKKRGRGGLADASGSSKKEDTKIIQAIITAAITRFRNDEEGDCDSDDNDSDDEEVDGVVMNDLAW